MRVAIFLALVLLMTIGDARAASKPAPHRELRRRALTIDDRNVSSVPEIHVGSGISTVLTFGAPLQDGGAFIADRHNLMDYITQTDRSVVLVPKRDLSAPVVLNVSLADRSVLTFKLLSTGQAVDVHVDVSVALEKSGTPESLANVKAALEETRAQLSECQASSHGGIAKLAAVLALNDLESPQTFERRRVTGGDKQSRLLVEARWVYRLLGTTFVVLNVANRDASRAWVLDRAGVRLAGPGSKTDVRVLTAATELPELPPEGEGKVVVAFTTPQRAQGQRLTLALFEKDGARHVTLDDLDL
jgi:uncharacterized protein (TIGR02268 family)